ncbi:MAG: hypothetical protein HY778_15455 [Betaproteobacteria bacterium]|nr:hypothetical protein [Betaproteobacteria bacterium]
MVIVEIALGIVLAVLILRYLPQIFNLAIGAVALSLLLGVVAGGIALIVNFPQLLYLGVIFIGIAFLLALADHANRYIQNNYERLPPWVKSGVRRAKGITWTLLLFSCFLAVLTSVGGLIALAWVLDSAKLLESFPSWAWTISCIAMPVVFTWLIYKLPWPAKVRGNENQALFP